jgi:hypothetical protein
VVVDFELGGRMQIELRNSGMIVKVVGIEVFDDIEVVFICRETPHIFVKELFDNLPALFRGHVVGVREGNNKSDVCPAFVIDAAAYFVPE